MADLTSPEIRKQGVEVSELRSGDIAVPEADVHHEKLSSPMVRYIRRLVKERPDWAKDFRIDERRAERQLQEGWPQIKGMEAQADKFLKMINSLIHSTDIIETSPNIIVRVEVSPERLVPMAMPQPLEPMTVLSFDAKRGMLHRCNLPAMDEPPPLDDMVIPSGLIIISQPATAMGNTVAIDNMPYQVGGDSDLYGTRNKDRVPRPGSPENIGEIEQKDHEYLLTEPSRQQEYNNLNPWNTRINITHRAESIHEDDYRKEREEQRLKMERAGAFAAIELRHKLADESQHHLQEKATEEQSHLRSEARESQHHKQGEATEELRTRKEESRESAQAGFKRAAEAGEAVQERAIEAVEARNLGTEGRAESEAAIASLAKQTAAAEAKIITPEGGEASGPTRPELPGEAAVIAAESGSHPETEIQATAAETAANAPTAEPLNESFQETAQAVAATGAEAGAQNEPAGVESTQPTTAQQEQAVTQERQVAPQETAQGQVSQESGIEAPSAQSGNEPQISEAQQPTAQTEGTQDSHLEEPRAGNEQPEARAEQHEEQDIRNEQQNRQDAQDESVRQNERFDETRERQQEVTREPSRSDEADPDIDRVDTDQRETLREERIEQRADSEGEPQEAEDNNNAQLAAYSGTGAENQPIVHHALQEAALHQMSVQPTNSGYAAAFVVTPSAAASLDLVHQAAIHTAPITSGGSQIGTAHMAAITENPAPTIAASSPSSSIVAGVTALSGIGGDTITPVGHLEATVQASLSPVIATPFLAVRSAPRMRRKIRVSPKPATARGTAPRKAPAQKKAAVVKVAAIKKTAVLKEGMRKAKAGTAAAALLKEDTAPAPSAADLPTLTPER